MSCDSQLSLHVCGQEITPSFACTKMPAYLQSFNVTYRYHVIKVIVGVKSNSSPIPTLVTHAMYIVNVQNEVCKFTSDYIVVMII